MLLQVLALWLYCTTTLKKSVLPDRQLCVLTTYTYIQATLSKNEQCPPFGDL